MNGIAGKALTLLASGLLLVTACGGLGAQPSGPQYTVALVNGNNSDPFFLTIWKGAKAEADKYNIKLIEVGPNKYDYTQQVPLLTDMIARKVNAILLAPDSDFALEPQMKAAQAAGIPVVMVNASKYTKPKYWPYTMSFLGTNPIELGNVAGDDLGKLTGGQGTVGIINSVAGSLGSQQRGQGAIDVLQRDYPKVNILPMQYSLNDQAKAYSIATDLMQAHPDLVGLYATDAFTGQGMATAIQAQHKQGTIKAVAIDAIPQEVEALKGGVYSVLIAQQPYKMGTQGIDYLYNALTGHKDRIPDAVYLTPISVTLQNLNTPEIQTILYAANGPR